MRSRSRQLGRRLLGTEVVLWRGASGAVNAFENRCAHRAFPLSHSGSTATDLVCGYHGCTYDTDGKCVYTPAQPQVPTGMRVRVFPVIEESPFVWIWLGQPSAAAGSQPPRMPWINDPAWTTFADAWQVNANYMMVHEHYLDFSYAPVVHKRDLPPGLDSMGAFNDVEVTETTVSYTRVLPELPLAGWQADATGLDGALPYKHREGGTFVSPAMHRQYWEIEAPDGKVYITTRTHGITPETENSTHVFMQSSRNYATDSGEVTDGLRSFLDDRCTTGYLHSGDGVQPLRLRRMAWRSGVSGRRRRPARPAHRRGDAGERSGPVGHPTRPCAQQ